MNVLKAEGLKWGARPKIEMTGRPLAYVLD